MLISLRRLASTNQLDNRAFFLLFVSFFVFSFGLVWAGSAIRSEIVNVDQDLLDIAQWSSGVVVIVVSLAYTALVDVIAKDRMLIGITLAGLAGAIAMMVVLTLVPAQAESTLYRNILLTLWALYMLMFYIWTIHWGTYIIDSFDIHTAKLIYPLLGNARPLGAILAAPGFEILARVSGNTDLPTMMIVWIITLSLTAALLAVTGTLIRRQQTEPEIKTSLGAESELSIAASLRNLVVGFQYLLKSPFMTWMALSAVIVIGLTTLFENWSSDIIQAQLARTADDPTAAFTNLTLWLDAIANAAALFLQFFVFNRLSQQLGLRTLVMIYPLITFAVSGGLILAPVIGTAVVAWIHINGVRRVFRDPVVGLMANAAPAQVKGRLRALINGIISPAGAVIIGLLLDQIPGPVRLIELDGVAEFTLLPAIPEVTYLRLLLGATAVLYVISAIVLRRQYASAMMHVLEQNNLSYIFSRTYDVDSLKMGVADRERLTMISRQLETTDDPDFKRFLVQVASQSGEREAVSIIEREMQNAAEPAYRQAVLQTFVTYSNPHRGLRPFYEALLRDDDPAIRSTALAGLEGILGGRQRDFHDMALQALNDPAPDVQAQVIPALLNNRKPTTRQLAEDALTALLASHDSERVILGLHALGQTGQRDAIHRLLPYLEAKDDGVRLAATKALDQLWTGSLPVETYAQLRAMLPLFLEDPVEEIRRLELRLLGRFEAYEAVPVLVRALGDPNAQIRREALAAVTQLGEIALPELESALEREDEQQVQLALIALQRLMPQKYQPMLEQYILETIDRLHAHHQLLVLLKPFTSLGSVLILYDALQEENDALLDDIFTLLGDFRGVAEQNIHLEVLREALTSSNAKERSNALETLEAAASPQIARRLKPLVDAESQAQVGQMDAFDVLYRFAFVDDHALSAMMVYAFAELGRLHPDLPETQREGHPLPPVDVPPEINQAALHAIDIRRLVVAVRGGYASRRPHMRAVARVGLRLLRGETLGERIRTRDYLDEEGTLLSTVERMIVLKKVALFSSVSIEHLQAVATICEERTYTRGDVIFRRHDTGNELFIIVDGVVQIGLHDDANTFTELARFSEGGYFGEMTLFHDKPRSATAIAANDVLVLTVHQTVLLRLMRQYPDLAVALLQTISSRLSVMNDRVAEMHNQDTAQTLTQNLQH